MGWKSKKRPPTAVAYTALAEGAGNADLVNTAPRVHAEHVLRADVYGGLVQLLHKRLAERADLIERDRFIHGDEAAKLGVLRLACALPALRLMLAGKQPREGGNADEARRRGQRKRDVHREEYQLFYAKFLCCLLHSFVSRGMKLSQLCASAMRTMSPLAMGAELVVMT